MRIDALREYRCISLILMDGPQIGAQHPHSWVEPLQGSKSVNENQVPRVAKTYMTSFMSKYSIVVSLVVSTIHHDIVHPAERCHFCVSAHANDGSIILRMLFAMSDHSDDSEQRHQGVSQRCHHTYYK